MTHQQRRSFIKMSLGTLGTLCIPMMPRSLWAAANSAEPHFYFQVYFSGGLDSTYLFDARPLALTQANVIQNYLGEDPQEWLGTNGTKCLATRLVNPLKPYRDQFSVLNGVVMATGFDGHDQNLNFLLTGDPFGGESFVPHLNRLSSVAPTPLDALIQGYYYANITNSGTTVPLTPDAAQRLTERLKKSEPLSSGSPLYNFILERMSMNAQGYGAFSNGAHAMQRSYSQAPAIAKMLMSLPQPAPVPSPAPPVAVDVSFLKTCMQLFKQGVTRSAIFIPTTNFDTHDATSARGQPSTIGQAAETLAAIFKILSETSFDDHRSFLDVTTVMAASEFGRTLRQRGVAIDATGTDHNSLTNSIIIGGKGIRGGQVFGETDQRTTGETLSKAHLRFDGQSLSMMGRPFDFATGLPRVDLPETYKPEDYLGMASVANSIYSLFGVSSAHYRKLARNGANAPLVPGLLR